MKGRATGVEVSTDWQATRRWRLRNSYAFLDKDIEARTARQAENAELGDPRHQLTHWSSLDLSSALEADIILRYVDELPVQGVDAYLDLDLRLGWRPRQAVRLSLGGRSLLDGGRREYLSGFQNVLPTRVERVLYVDATWYLGSN
jgi:iron complex outermembrane receptor protein